MSQSKNNEVEMQQREHEAKEWIIYILYKLHHLLRTHQLSGIYSLPNTTRVFFFFFNSKEKRQPFKQ